MAKRVFLIVLDSFGVGAEPDAPLFGDVGTNTLGAIAGHLNFRGDNLARLGMFNLDGVTCGTPAAAPIGSYARLREASAGKDTTIGHWEIAGLLSAEPLPTFPDGFPQELLDAFTAKTGYKVLCNKPYSGTDVIRDYGEEHMKTGALIVYTSADSVFQIAANEAIVPVEKLYEICAQARELLTGKYGVGRVIARPFVGDCAANFTRTPRRHDYSLVPPHDTMLDAILAAGKQTIGVGKIHLFLNHLLKKIPVHSQCKDTSYVLLLSRYASSPASKQFSIIDLRFNLFPSRSVSSSLVGYPE